MPAPLHFVTLLAAKIPHGAECEVRWNLPCRVQLSELRVVPLNVQPSVDRPDDIGYALRLQFDAKCADSLGQITFISAFLDARVTMTILRHCCRGRCRLRVTLGSTRTDSTADPLFRRSNSPAIFLQYRCKYTALLLSIMGRLEMIP